MALEIAADALNSHGPLTSQGAAKTRSAANVYNLHMKILQRVK